MRCVIGSIRHETNTFSTLKTQLEDFHVVRGAEMQLGEFWKSFENIEWVPTLSAGAGPHGLVSKDAYLKLKQELINRISDAMPIDGVYMGLHGALEVEEIGDGESDLVGDVRGIVGWDIPIVASLDLHGNIAPALAKSTNILTALRTAPHIDGLETERRAVGHLVRCLKEDIRPINIMIKLPLLLPGEFAVTEVEPARSLYSKLQQIESEQGILDASIMIGCAWTDSPYNTVSVIVVAEEDSKKARECANSLANDIWSHHKEFKADTETACIEEAVAKAIQSRENPVFISDSGDNVTAGGAGDIPIILEKLLEAGATDIVVAGITDADAVKQCIQTGVGSVITLSIGGKLDKANGYPLEVTGAVEYLKPPSLAVLKVKGVRVVLASDRRAFASLHNFEQVNINPSEQKIVVVKLGYLFAELRPIARKSIMALSPGFTTLLLDQLPYKNIIHPIYPLDGDFEWTL